MYFYCVYFLSVFRGKCFAFLYPLGQLLEHFVPFCTVLMCTLSKLIGTVFNERNNVDDDDDVKLDSP